MPSRRQAIIWTNDDYFTGTYICVTRPQWVNSLGPGDAIWQRIGLTLVQVMACCLMVPSNCLNQFWLIISEVLWHSPVGNFSQCSRYLSLMIISSKITNLEYSCICSWPVSYLIVALWCYGQLLFRNRNLYQNTMILIQWNAFENVIWKMAVILPLTQCVKDNGDEDLLFIILCVPSIHGLAWSQPMSEDVTYVTSSLIG